MKNFNKIISLLESTKDNQVLGLSLVESQFSEEERIEFWLNFEDYVFNGNWEWDVIDIEDEYLFKSKPYKLKNFDVTFEHGFRGRFCYEKTFLDLRIRIIFNCFELNKEPKETIHINLLRKDDDTKDQILIGGFDKNKTVREIMKLFIESISEFFKELSEK